MLQVTIVEATNPWASGEGGASVVVTLNGSTQRTHLASGTAGKPTIQWGTKFDYKLDDFSGPGVLNLALYEMPSKTSLGKLSVDLNTTRERGHLASSTPYDFWVELLQLHTGSGGQQGWGPAKTSDGKELQLHLKLLWISPTQGQVSPNKSLPPDLDDGRSPKAGPMSITESTQPTKQARVAQDTNQDQDMDKRLRVRVIESKNLPPTTEGSYLSYCVLRITPRLNEQIFHTDTACVKDPKWNETFMFDIDDPRLDRLALVVCNNEEETVQSRVGKQHVRLDTLKSDKPCMMTLPLMYRNDGAWGPVKQAAIVLELTAFGFGSSAASTSKA
mmetsp:Transcript_20941/g.37402  ORF Transcript_20941/g.37402 Transcript_20941/m.37402 type:complete len:331 (-) Transcript_20941:410-1402(-)